MKGERTVRPRGAQFQWDMGTTPPGEKSGMAVEAVCCELVSAGRIPCNRGKYREFSELPRAESQCSSAIPRFLRFSTANLTGNLQGPNRERLEEHWHFSLK